MNKITNLNARRLEPRAGDHIVGAPPCVGHGGLEPQGPHGGLSEGGAVVGVHQAEGSLGLEIRAWGDVVSTCIIWV